MTETTRVLERPTGVWSLTGRVDSDSAVRAIEISSSPFRIGRRSDCALTLLKETVTGVHAEIVVSGDSLWVRDLESTNGTFVNGKPVQGRQPLRDGDLVQFADLAFRLRHHAAPDANPVQPCLADTADEVLADTSERAYSLFQFDKLMTEGAVVPYFQPVVSLPDKRTVGYEVLGRSRLFGLRTPRDMFRAASQLELEEELSKLLRLAGVVKGSKLPDRPNLFVNTHPSEIVTDGLLESLRRLRQLKPDQPVTLEVHESAVTDAGSMKTLRGVLTELDMKLAYDDFGAGQSRLVELSSVRPEIVKFDMSLIREIHLAASDRQRMVASLVRMVQDLGIVALAEGVETGCEHAACCKLGFEMGQGYFYGRPHCAADYSRGAHQR